jgi:hypothetical protein
MVIQLHRIILVVLDTLIESQLPVAHMPQHFHLPDDGPRRMFVMVCPGSAQWNMWRLVLSGSCGDR